MGDVQFINSPDPGNSNSFLPAASAATVPGLYVAAQNSPAAIKDREPSIGDVIAIFKKRKKLIAASTLLCSFFGILYCLFATKYYTAVSDVEIKGYAPVLAGAPVENLYGLDTRRLDYQKTTIAKLKRLGVADRALSEENLEQEVQKYFKKRKESFLDKVWKKVLSFTNPDSVTALKETKEADANFVHDPKLLSNYLSLIDVNPVHETSIVEIAVTTSSPKFSQKIANIHARVFIDELKSERQDSVMANLKILQQQASELKDKLTNAEQDLAKYAEANQLVSVSNAQDANIIVKQIVNLTELLTQATAKRVKSESLLKEIESRDPKKEESSLDDDTLRAARESLQLAQAEYASLSRKVTDEYPKMIELKARIKSLQDSIAGSYRRTLEGLKVQYNSDAASEKKLIQQIDTAKAQAHEMSKRLVQYNLLLKESESIRQLYETVLRQTQETQISGINGSNNIVISDFASRPSKPSAPLTKLVILISTVLGAMLGVLAAVVLEVINNKILTPEDASRSLDMPLLGYVPSFGNKVSEPFIKTKLLQLMHRASSANGSAKAANNQNSDEVPQDNLPAIAASNGAQKSGDKLTKLAGAFVTIDKPHAIVSEALRTIRASILLSTADNPPKVIMVTSSEKGEGKTTVISNLAITLAQAGHKTLLIDSDLRQSKVCTLFNLPRSRPGLSDFLAGQMSDEELICQTSIQNVDVLLSGSVPPNPAELIGSKKMGQLVKALRERYDFVLIDCAPILPVADSLMLSRVVDSVIFVTRSNFTERGAGQEARRRLRNVNARILGVVLNDFDLSSQAGDSFGSVESHNYYVQNNDDDDHRVAWAG